MNKQLVFNNGTYSGNASETHFFNELTFNLTNYYSLKTNNEFHSHSDAHLSFVLDGNYQENRKNNEFQRKSGDIMFCNAFETHKFETRNSFRNLNIEISNTFLSTYNIHENQIENSIKVNSNAKANMLKILFELRQNDQNIETTLLILLLDIILPCIEKPLIHKPNWIDSLQDIISDRWNEKITLTELSQAIQIHPVTISKKFSKYFGFDSIPCQKTYPKWDTKNTFTYSKSIWENDSVIDLDTSFLKMEFAFPIQNKPAYKYHATITSEYGQRNGKAHEGVDVELHVNDSVYACFSGVVRLARSHGGYGRVVVVRHDNGLETLYGHLHRFKVKDGQRVAPGELIGLGGSSGHSTGSHLHFETRYKGRTIDPEQIINFKERKLNHNAITLRRNRKGYVAFEGAKKLHTVTKRESMYKICKRYGLYFTELRALNGWKENRKFENGDVVRIR